jgi:hypothetical protein
VQNTWPRAVSVLAAHWNSNSNTFIILNPTNQSIATSQDLINWTYKSSFDQSGISIATNGGGYLSSAHCNTSNTLMVISPSRCYTSNNLGDFWTDVSTSFAANTPFIFSGPYYVSANNTEFIGYDNTGYTAFSPANGSYWYDGKLTPSSHNLKAMGYTSNYPLRQIAWIPQNNFWVAVGANSAATSSNGRTWTYQSSFSSAFGVGNTAYWIASNGISNMCAVGTSCATSTDGVTWTYQPSFRTAIGNSTEDCRKIIWANDKYVAITNTGNIITSTSGSNWVSQPSSNNIISSAYVYGLVSSQNNIVFFGQANNIPLQTSIVNSSNGFSWTSISNNNLNDAFNSKSNYVNDIVYNGSQYLAVSQLNECVTSPNGINWTKQNGFSTTWGEIGNTNKITWTGSQYLVYGGYGKLISSTDGISWTNYSSNIRPAFGSTSSNTIYSLIYTGSQYVAVGAFGKCANSSDLITWTAQPNFTSAFGSGGSNIALSIAFSGSIYVTVGQAVSNCVTSTDLVTWTPRPSFRTAFGQSNTAYAMVWSGNKFLAVGQNAVISSDGITWSVAGNFNTIKKSNAYYNVLWTGSQFITVGAFGDCLTSFDGITWQSSNSSIFNGLLRINGSAYNSKINQLVVGGYFFTNGSYNRTRAYYSLK